MIIQIRIDEAYTRQEIKAVLQEYSIYLTLSYICNPITFEKSINMIVQ